MIIPRSASRLGDRCRRLLPPAALALASLAAAVLHPLAAQSRERSLGIDTSGFDRSVRPQDDFFRFVNGGWIDRQEIPADASRWGSFDRLAEGSRSAVRAILEEAAQGSAPAGSELRKIGDLYAAYMDSARIEQRGLAALAADTALIGGLRHTAQLPSVLARLARHGVAWPAAVGVGADPKASLVNIVQVGQSGLGMPDRDYYLRDDPKTVETRAAYREYVRRLLALAGDPDAEGSARRVVDFETALAARQWDRARSRDRNATYNRMTVGELAALTPGFDWRHYLRDAGLGTAREVIVRQPDYLRALDSLVTATPPATWRAYLTAQLLDNYAEELPAAYGAARFDFRGRTLGGQRERGPRWKRAVAGVERALGEAVGRVYVARHFRADARARMDSLVHNLREAYRQGIDSLEWMSPATKAEARAKLARFTVKIGYPERWRDYSALRITRDDLLGDAIRAEEYRYDDIVSRLGKPVDRTRWGMTPQTVNAYYNASNNEIVFPAAILQPPFFDVEADDAVNYGAIGAVIGHEIGHGFDDQGRKSDGGGNLRDWWTAEDARAFESRAAKLGAQYAALTPIDDLHINPRLTMGENIGDLSGLAQAYRAYRLSLRGAEPPVIGGFTGDQRFFMGFAQVWRAKYRDAALRRQLLTNPHSPDMVRAFIPLVNNDAFQRAFGVRPGDRMYRAPEERVRIW